MTSPDVLMFCGSAGGCDPRPYLCPHLLSSSASTLPVGFVRAFLHKFLYAYPAFQGTGFTDENNDVEEFIVVPSIYLAGTAVKMTQPQHNVSDACPAQHRI
eukprot:SRR837773.13804.p2 GENE.SRR837773.13804~~SRR837773.13804.p2  ORF type:complete len:101 (-),score=14.91 SRR837773.13804:48-350(-)